MKNSRSFLLNLRQKQAFVISLCFTCIFIFSSCTIKNNDNLIPNPENPQVQEKDNDTHNAYAGEEEIGDTSPVSRSLAAKMAALLFYDIISLNVMEEEISLTDTTPDKWFYKYVNYIAAEGYMDTQGDTFNPSAPLTINAAQSLLNKINPNNEIKIKITEENKNKSISYALWSKLYYEAAKKMAQDKSLEQAFGIEEQLVIPLAASGTNSYIPDGFVITDKGPFSCQGLSFDMYIDKEIKVLIKDNEIIAALSITDETPLLKNAFVVAVNDTSVTIFSGGAEREYAIENPMKEWEGRIADIQISSENNASHLVTVGESIRDTIKLVSDTEIETLNNGVLQVSKDFKVYSTTEGEIKWKTINDLIVGTDLADIYVADGIAHAAVIREIPKPDKIRVVIKNNDYSSFFHDEVSITSNEPFKVTIGGDTKEYPAYEKVDFTSAADLAERAFIEPTGGLITLNSVSRSSGMPAYRGTVEILGGENGFIIVNEVPLEEYLYSVVPSEMPTAYGLEALKAQAVTARSYAYNQFYGNTFRKYGANVCDSVISQVYNNIPETELSIKAVNDTDGLFLKYNGDVISANFFSTSSGVTANNGEVWADVITKAFPAPTAPYLKSKQLYQGEDYGDLRLEENAARFFKAQDVKAYDSFSNWFRWSLEMTNEELTAAINANIKERYEAEPKLIKTLQADGRYKSQYLDSIGTLVTLQVLERGEGGNITKMRIEGTEKTIIVNTEYNIRNLLRPKQYQAGKEGIVINRSDGSAISDYALMPSAFFTMERMTMPDGTIKSVKFFGGGNGHGVGMSQVGAKGMADHGATFDEILTFFYDGTEVSRIE